MSNGCNYGTGFEASRAYLERIKSDHTFAMRVQKCLDDREREELLREEGYAFTNSELSAAKKELSKNKKRIHNWLVWVICTAFSAVITYIVYMVGKAKELASRELLREAFATYDLDKASASGRMARDASYYDTYVIILLILTLCCLAASIVTYMQHKKDANKA